LQIYIIGKITLSFSLLKISKMDKLFDNSDIFNFFYHLNPFSLHSRSLIRINEFVTTRWRTSAAVAVNLSGNESVASREERQSGGACQSAPQDVSIAGNGHLVRPLANRRQYVLGL